MPCWNLSLYINKEVKNKFQKTRKKELTGEEGCGNITKLSPRTGHERAKSRPKRARKKFLTKGQESVKIGKLLRRGGSKKYRKKFLTNGTE